MNCYLKTGLLFYLILLMNLSLNAQFNIAQEAAKADKENPRSGLTRVKIGTNKYAYYDEKYINVKHKYVYFANTEDEKTINYINRVFNKYNISAINFHDLKKPANYTEAQLNDILKKENIEGFIKINITDEVIVYPETSFYMYNVGNYTVGKSSYGKSKLAITTYIDFFDNIYGKNPFVRVIATSESSRMNLEYILVEKNLDYMLDRLINEYKVLLKNE